MKKRTLSKSKSGVLSNPVLSNPGVLNEQMHILVEEEETSSSEEETRSSEEETRSSSRGTTISQYTAEPFANTELKEILGSDYLNNDKTFTLPVKIIVNPSIDIIIAYFGNIVKEVNENNDCSFNYLKDFYYINNMKDKLEKSKIEICNCIYKSIIDVFKPPVNNTPKIILNDLNNCTNLKGDIFICIRMILNFIHSNTITFLSDDNPIKTKTKTNTNDINQDDDDPWKKLLCILYILHNTTLSLSTFSKKTISHEWSKKIKIVHVPNGDNSEKYRYDDDDDRYTVTPIISTQHQQQNLIDKRQVHRTGSVGNSSSTEFTQENPHSSNGSSAVTPHPRRPLLSRQRRQLLLEGQAPGSSTETPRPRRDNQLQQPPPPHSPEEAPVSRGDQEESDSDEEERREAEERGYYI